MTALSYVAMSKPHAPILTRRATLFIISHQPLSATYHISSDHNRQTKEHHIERETTDLLSQLGSRVTL